MLTGETWFIDFTFISEKTTFCSWVIVQKKINHKWADGRYKFPVHRKARRVSNFSLSWFFRVFFGPQPNHIYLGDRFIEQAPELRGKASFILLFILIQGIFYFFIPSNPRHTSFLHSFQSKVSFIPSFLHSIQSKASFIPSFIQGTLHSFIQSNPKHPSFRHSFQGIIHFQLIRQYYINDNASCM